MRFGSIRAFLKFIQMLEGIGYNAQCPLYNIEECIKSLPDYISNYQVIITLDEEDCVITFERNKQYPLNVSLTRRPL